MRTERESMKASKSIQVAKKTIKVMIIVILAAAALVSAFELCKICATYITEAVTKGNLAPFRPDSADGNNPESSPQASTANLISGLDMPDAGSSAPAFVGSPQHERIIVNQSIVDLRDEVNPDVIGWLTIPDTRVDYPFVLCADNSYYLDRDLYGKDAAAGTLFMDFRCSEDLSDFNTIVYGHNMKNNSMFGDLSHFADTWFFDNNRYGTIFLDDGTYTLVIFAYMVVSATDEVVYDPAVDSAEYYEYAAKYARNYRTPDTSANVVTLSTCGYEFSGVRIVLLANIA